MKRASVTGAAGARPFSDFRCGIFDFMLAVASVN